MNFDHFQADVAKSVLVLSGSLSLRMLYGVKKRTLMGEDADGGRGRCGSGVVW